MKLIILDRDGVINQDSPNYIKSLDEWIPILGSLEAIAKLNHAGFSIVVATNQSGIGRGYYSLEILNQIHKKMLGALKKHGGKIDKIYICPHTPDDHCDCRKPKIGLLKQIAQDYKTNLQDTVLIGDDLRDIQAGLAAGCHCFLVRTGKGKKVIRENSELLKENNIKIFDDLLIAAQYLIGQN